MSAHEPRSQPGWHMDQRLALHNVQVPRSARVLARLLVVLLVVTAVAFTLTPWQQNITGSGRVIAFSPEERTQQIDTPVDGRIVRWHVVEGDTVARGAPIVDLTDNDPAIIERMRQEREQIARTVVEGASRSRSLNDRIVGLIETLNSSVTAAGCANRWRATASSRPNRGSRPPGRRP